MHKLDGILPVLKPAGWTSHDVVAKVRGILRLKRIGHAGTLDPAVTGVLPLALDRSTRFIEYLQEMPKEYVAEMTIGYATDTEDTSGQVIERVEAVQLDLAEIKRTLEQFVGEIEQVPPMYSAVKVDGKRLYELARQGQEVERKPRKVVIHQLVLEEAELAKPYPKLRLRVICSRGTYIRTLCKDIGEALEYPAVMSDLVRTMSCGIMLSQCLTLERIAELHAQGKLADCLISADEALTDMPAVHVDEQTAVRLLQGQRVKLSTQPSAAGSEPQKLARVYGPGERFIGICQVQGRLIIPHKMFQS